MTVPCGRSGSIIVLAHAVRMHGMGGDWLPRGTGYVQVACCWYFSLHSVLCLPRILRRFRRDKRHFWQISSRLRRLSAFLQPCLQGRAARGCWAKRPGRNVHHETDAD